MFRGEENARESRELCRICEVNGLYAVAELIGVAGVVLVPSPPGGFTENPPAEGAEGLRSRRTSRGIYHDSRRCDCGFAADPLVFGCVHGVRWIARGVGRVQRGRVELRDGS